MLTTSISDFRKDIKRYFDKVTQNFETLIINRGKDNGVVIMSLAEYNSLCSTQHELSSKENERIHQHCCFDCQRVLLQIKSVGPRRQHCVFCIVIHEKIATVC